MSDGVTLTIKEQKRLRLLSEVESGIMTVVRTAEILGLSERQVYRLLARYRREGAAVLAHGNRGRPSPRQLPKPLRDRIVQLIRKRYSDYNTISFGGHRLQIPADRYRSTYARCLVEVRQHLDGQLVTGPPVSLLGSRRKRPAPGGQVHTP